MGCCLFATLLAGAPRLAFLLWWLFQPVRINATFSSFIMPLLGVLFVPWTTIAYVALFPGGITGFDWVLIAFAFFVDLSTYGGGYRSRAQYS
jgi:hypothetical protein